MADVMTRKNSAIDSDHGKPSDEVSLSAKSDQDYFEEAIAGINSDTAGGHLSATSVAHINSQEEDNNILARDENNSAANALNPRLKTPSGTASVQRRTNLMKRRYKSGVPLSGNERNDEDHNDDIFMKQLIDTNINKQSKDDSGKRFYIKLKLIGKCL